MLFLATLIFSLCSSKFPVGFNQIQARFMSLVNLGIFLGEKTPGYFFFFFLSQGEKRRVFCQAGFPKFS